MLCCWQQWLNEHSYTWIAIDLYQVRTAVTDHMVSTAQIEENVVLGMFNKVTWWINWCSVVLIMKARAVLVQVILICMYDVDLGYIFQCICQWHVDRASGIMWNVISYNSLLSLWKQCTVPFMFRTLFSCNFYSRKVMCCFRRIMLAHVMHVLLSMLCKMFIAGMIVRLIYTVWFTGSFSLSTTLTVLCQQMQKSWTNVAG